MRPRNIITLNKHPLNTLIRFNSSCCSNFSSPGSHIEIASMLAPTLTTAYLILLYIPISGGQLSQPMTEKTELKPNKYQALTPLKAEQLIL